MENKIEELRESANRLKSMIDDSEHVKDLNIFLDNLSKTNTEISNPGLSEERIREMRGFMVNVMMDYMIKLVEYIKPPKVEDEGGKLKIDVHVHSKLTRLEDFHPRYYQAMIDIAVKKGLDGIVCLEHFDIAGEFLSNLQHHRMPKLREEHKDFTILYGGEVNIREGGSRGGDIILIGNVSDLIAIDEYFHKAGSHRISSGYKPSYNELMLALTNNEIRERMAVIAAHIFRENQILCNRETLLEVDGVDLTSADALDTSAKDYDLRKLVMEKADQNKNTIGITCSSDAHVPLEVGSLYTLFDPLGDSSQDFDIHPFICQLKGRQVIPPMRLIEDREIDEDTQNLIYFSRLYKEIIEELVKKEQKD